MDAADADFFTSAPLVRFGTPRFDATSHGDPDSAEHGAAPAVVAAVDPDEEDEDLGDEEDLSVAQPTADDESGFDDFDDEFDDDFEEEENDPYWDHPDDGDAEPPPGKPPGRKK